MINEFEKANLLVQFILLNFFLISINNLHNNILS